MEKKPIIKLRTYRGREINYDANGKIKNENNLVSLEHNTIAWKLFMKNLPLNGYCKVDVESGFKQLSSGYEPIEDLTDFQTEVNEAFNPKKKLELTPEQKQISELRSQLDALMKGDKPKKKEKKEDKKVEATKNKEIKTPTKADLKEEYKELYGKNPFNGWDEDKLAEMIADKKK